jgi:hypothetical protein
MAGLSPPRRPLASAAAGDDRNDEFGELIDALVPASAPAPTLSAAPTPASGSRWRWRHFHARPCIFHS